MTSVKERPIRICQVVNNLDVGGLEKVVIELLTYLPRDSVEPYLICLSGPGALYDSVDLPSERCLILDKPKDLSGLAAKLNTRQIIRAIRQFIVRNRIEIVHTHNLAPLIFAGIASRSILFRPAIVYTEHNQIYRASELGMKRFKRYAKLADAVITVSHDLERTLLNRVGIHRQIDVIHYGIDGRKFEAVTGDSIRRELGFTPDEYIAGTAVVISEQKGIRYLLDAAEIASREDPAIRFVIAGDGPLREELQTAMRARKLDEVVRFLGFRSDIPDLLAAFDVYVLPSLWEGLPLALLEALAVGKPIVATTVGGNPEIVLDGINGFLVPPKDPAALADRVLRLKSDPMSRERIRRSNRERFASRFSLETMIGNHQQFYDRLLSDRSGSRIAAAIKVLFGS